MLGDDEQSSCDRVVINVYLSIFLSYKMGKNVEKSVKLAVEKSKVCKYIYN